MEVGGVSVGSRAGGHAGGQEGWGGFRRWEVVVGDCDGGWGTGYRGSKGGNLGHEGRGLMWRLALIRQNTRGAETKV